MDNYKYPVTEYLTRYLEKITTKEIEFDFEKEEHIFNKTFKFINDNWGEDAFSGKSTKGTIKNEFVLYLFDGITIPLYVVIK